MSEFSDSDGEWILVNKETDSETSSVVAVCETEFQSESLFECEGDDLWKNDWCNRDEIITDSDIKACTEGKEPDMNCDACTQISVDTLAPCSETESGISESVGDKQGSCTLSQSVDQDEDSHDYMINGINVMSQSEGVICSSADSWQEQENDGGIQMCEASLILSPVSSESDFEKLALSDAQSLSSDEGSSIEEESTVSVAGLENSRPQEEFLSQDSSSQTNETNPDAVESSVQAVVSCTDASTESEIDGYPEKNETIVLARKQKFVLPLIMIGVGFFLGRCSVPYSSMGSTNALVSNCKKLVSVENPSPPSFDARHMTDVPAIPCASTQDMLCPSLKMRIEKEFERQKTHIEMLTNQLQSTRIENSMQVKTLEKKLRSKELNWENLQLVHKNTIESLQANEKHITEKYNGMKLRVQRYRLESKRLISGISVCKRQSRYLRSISERSSRLHALRDVSLLSPLVHALRKEISTCESTDRLKCETAKMRPHLMTEESTINSLELDLKRNSLAIQALYQSVMDQNTVAIPINQPSDQTGESMWHPYIHFANIRSQMESSMKDKDRNYRQLEVEYLSVSQSLAIAERQKSNLKRHFTDAKAEIELLQQEKNDLKQRLQNATMQLKQKSSLQHCVKSAITNKLTKLNDSRLYKTANKLAEKFTKTSKQAWYKVQNLARKLSQSTYDIHNGKRRSTTKDMTLWPSKNHNKKGKFAESKKQHKEKRPDKHAGWSKLRDANNQNHGRNNDPTQSGYKKHHDDHYDTYKPHEYTGRSSDTDHDEKSSLDEVVSDHVAMAKKVGVAVMHHLTPIYQKCEEVYCDVKGKISQKSFQEVWDSVVESAKTMTPGGKEKQEKLTIWVWDAYNNFTKSVQPVVADVIPYSWPFSKNNQQTLDLSPMEQESLDHEEESIGNKVSVNPQWFFHMFQERESLRKENPDSPLSEEEFDWFLQMFSERERLRHSDNDYGDDSDNDYLDYDDISDTEMDWYLKMFESRARLRFQNDEDNKNRYIKMSAARNNARMERHKMASSQWYTDMFEARKSLREKNRKVCCYPGKTTKKQDIRQEKVTFHRDGRCKA